jgi:hypothetical protein
MSNMTVKLCTGGRGVGVQGAADSPHPEDGPLHPGGAQEARSQPPLLLHQGGQDQAHQAALHTTQYLYTIG